MKVLNVVIGAELEVEASDELAAEVGSGVIGEAAATKLAEESTTMKRVLTELKAQGCTSVWVKKVLPLHKEG